MTKSAKSTIQRWGNSLAVRIPDAIARAARFSVGQPVEVVLEEAGVVVKPVEDPKLTLTQKLDLYEPAEHGGEVMAAGRIGTEPFNGCWQTIAGRKVT